MQLNMRKRSIWKNLFLALLATPMACFIGLIIITVVGALDDLITEIQVASYWWLLFIVTFILSFIYFSYEEGIKINRKRKKTINAMILYWKEQLAKKGKEPPSDGEIKFAGEMFMERLNGSGLFDAELWERYFPKWEYSDYIFEIVDNFMVFYEEQKKRDGVV